MQELADELSDIRAFNSKRGPRCSVGVLLNSCDPGLRQTLIEAMEDPTIQAKGLSRWLMQRHEIECSHWAIQYHRRGDCACG